jgi:hypothetical protein
MANGTVIRSLPNAGAVDPQQTLQPARSRPRGAMTSPGTSPGPSTVSNPVATPYSVQAKLAQAELVRSAVRATAATPTATAAKSRPATIWQDGRTLSTTARRGTYLNIVV